MASEQDLDDHFLQKEELQPKDPIIEESPSKQSS